MDAVTLSRAINLPIGKLSKRSGVNIETIRYYERIKMLPAPCWVSERRKLPYALKSKRLLPATVKISGRK